MRDNLYVSMTGQIALEKRLETIASNVANMNTGGFRAGGVTFSTVLSKTGDNPTAFVKTGTDYISRLQGGITQTNNPYDVAIQGDAWFAIQTPDGIAYTRDGRMKMTATGELKTLNNYPILDAGRAGILLEASGGQPMIASDGMISQGGRQVGAIGLFTIPEDAKLSRYDNSAVFPDQPTIPVLDFSRTGVQQGFSESSNVNPVLEMSKLIEIQRAFDGITNSTQTSEASLQEAIKTLGSST